MSGVSTRRRANAAKVVLPAVLGLFATLTACGAGQVSQTADQASAVNGYTGNVGKIAVRNATIAFTGPGNADAIYRTGQAAPLDLSVVNTGAAPDKLLRIDSPIAASGVIQGDATIGGGQTIMVGNTDQGSDASSLAARTLGVQLVGLKRDIVAGRNYPVTLTFQHAGVLNASLPVGSPTGPTGSSGRQTAPLQQAAPAQAAPAQTAPQQAGTGQATPQQPKPGQPKPGQAKPGQANQSHPIPGHPTPGHGS